MSIVESPHDAICKRVIHVLHKVSGIPENSITPDSSFDDLELDSLSRIELLVEIEREFNLEMPEDTDDEMLIQKIHSVQDATQMVLDHLNEASSAKLTIFQSAGKHPISVFTSLHLASCILHPAQPSVHQHVSRSFR